MPNKIQINQFLSKIAKYLLYHEDIATNARMDFNVFIRALVAIQFYP